MPLVCATGRAHATAVAWCVCGCVFVTSCLLPALCVTPCLVCFFDSSSAMCEGICLYLSCIILTRVWRDARSEGFLEPAFACGQLVTSRRSNSMNLYAIDVRDMSKKVSDTCRANSHRSLLCTQRRLVRRQAATSLRARPTEQSHKLVGVRQEGCLPERTNQLQWAPSSATDRNSQK